MSIETHINTYIEDVENAYEEAAAALGKFHTAVEALKGKYASHVAAVATAVGQSVPEIEALVPAAKPDVEEAESVVNQVEQDAKSLDSGTTKGTTPPAKS